MPASRLLLGLLGATGCAGAALVAVLVRWKKDGTLDDLMSRLAFQISRYAQRHELKFRPDRIFVLRHGESEGNVDRTLFQRLPDYEHSLTPLGRRQASEAGRRLKEIIGDESVYFQVSPYRRTRETLKEILSHFIENLDVQCGSPLRRQYRAPGAEERGTDTREQEGKGTGGSAGIGNAFRRSARAGEESGSCSESASAPEPVEAETCPIFPNWHAHKGEEGSNLCYLRCRSHSLQNMLQAEDEDVFVWPNSSRLKVREDARLREQEFGNFQNPGTISQAMRDRHLYGPFWYRFEHGESGGDVWDRISDWWASMFRDMSRLQVRNYVIVTHGITQRCLCMYYFKWSVEEFNRIVNPDNCEIWELQRGADFKYHLASPVRCRNGCPVPDHMRDPPPSFHSAHRPTCHTQFENSV